MAEMVAIRTLELQTANTNLHPEIIDRMQAADDLRLTDKDNFIKVITMPFNSLDLAEQSGTDL